METAAAGQDVVGAQPNTIPAWEQRAAPLVRGMSPNIKQKKRVAALFGGKVPETASS